MVNLFWLSDTQWRAIEPLLSQLGDMPRVDDRRLISGILHRFREGLTWREVPRVYGYYTTLCRRLNHWSRVGIWEHMLAALAACDDPLLVATAPEQPASNWTALPLLEEIQRSIGIGAEDPAEGYLARVAINRHVGIRIRAARRLNEMSSNALANVLGISRVQLWKYERGIADVTSTTLFHLAAALKVPIDFFFSGLPGAKIPSESSSSAPNSQPRETEALAVLLESLEARRLAVAFAQVHDVRMREQVLRLVQSVAHALAPKWERPPTRRTKTNIRNHDCTK